MLAAGSLPPLGPVATGDQLYVVRPAGKYTAREEIPVTVDRVARAWVYVKRDDGRAPSVLRMRLDDLTNGSNSIDRTFLRSREQLDFEAEIRRADETIYDFGLIFRSGRWPVRQRIRLAELLRENEAELRPKGR